MNIHEAAKLIGRIVAIFAMVEAMIMLLLGNAAWQLTTLQTAILDTLLLVVLSTPPIYYFVVRPFILARDEALELVQHLATSDPLTQLPNRRLLEEYIGKMLSSARRHQHCGAVMMLDLDDFKPINDAHGHAAGDAILIEVAERLRRTNRTEDLVSRLGGDEFVVMLGQLDPSPVEARKKAFMVAKKIAEVIARPVRYQGRELMVGCSIGITITGEQSKTVEQVLREADRGMYLAKRDRECSVVVYDEANYEQARAFEASN